MIIELEDELKSCSLAMLAIYLYFICNQVLIKFNQLKLLNASSPVHYKAFAFILFPTLAEYDKCSPLI
jgi:hypothetical protein